MVTIDYVVYLYIFVSGRTQMLLSVTFNDLFITWLDADVSRSAGVGRNSVMRNVVSCERPRERRRPDLLPQFGCISGRHSCSGTCRGMGRARYGSPAPWWCCCRTVRLRPHGPRYSSDDGPRSHNTRLSPLMRCL